MLDFACILVLSPWFLFFPLALLTLRVELVWLGLGVAVIGNIVFQTLYSM